MRSLRSPEEVVIERASSVCCCRSRLLALVSRLLRDRYLVLGFLGDCGRHSSAGGDESCSALCRVGRSRGAVADETSCEYACRVPGSWRRGTGAGGPCGEDGDGEDEGETDDTDAMSDADDLGRSEMDSTPEAVLLPAVFAALTKRETVPLGRSRTMRNGLMTALSSRSRSGSSAMDLRPSAISCVNTSVSGGIAKKVRKIAIDSNCATVFMAIIARGNSAVSGLPCVAVSRCYARGGVQIDSERCVFKSIVPHVSFTTSVFPSAASTLLNLFAWWTATSGQGPPREDHARHTALAISQDRMCAVSS